MDTHQDLRRRRLLPSHRHDAAFDSTIHPDEETLTAAASSSSEAQTSSNDLALAHLGSGTGTVGRHYRWGNGEIDVPAGISTQLTTRSTADDTSALPHVPQGNNYINRARSRYLNQRGQQNLSVVNNNHTTNHYRISTDTAVPPWDHGGGGGGGDTGSGGVPMPSSKEYRKLGEEQRIQQKQKQQRGTHEKPGWWRFMFLLASGGDHGRAFLATTLRVNPDEKTLAAHTATHTLRAASRLFPVASSPGILTGRTTRRAQIDNTCEQGQPEQQGKTPVSNKAVPAPNDGILAMHTTVDAFTRQLATSCMCAGPQVLSGTVEKEEPRVRSRLSSSLSGALRDFCIAPKSCKEEEGKERSLKHSDCSSSGSSSSTPGTRANQEWHFHRVMDAHARVDQALLDNDAHRAVEAARDKLSELEGMYEEELEEELSLHRPDVTGMSSTILPKRRHEGNGHQQDPADQEASWGGGIISRRLCLLRLWIKRRLVDANDRDKDDETSQQCIPRSTTDGEQQQHRFFRQATAARLLCHSEKAVVSSLDRLRGLRDALGDLVSAVDDSAYLAGKIERGLSSYKAEGEAEADVRQLFFMSWYQGQGAVKVCRKEELTVGDAVIKLTAQLAKVRRLMKQTGDDEGEFETAAGESEDCRRRVMESSIEGLSRDRWLEVVEGVADVLDEVERWNQAFSRQVGERGGERRS